MISFGPKFFTVPRVLRIINRFNLGGPTYNAAYLTKHLPEEFETLLVGGQKDESEDSSEFIVESLGLSPHIIPEMRREVNLKMDRIAYKKIKQLIRDFKPDIVHTHASKAGALGRLAAHRMKVPVIVHTFHGHVFHSYFGARKTDAYKRIERYLAKRSSAIIAISPLQKQELSEQHKIAPPEKFEVVPLGFDLDRFQADKEAKRKAFREHYQLEDDEVAVGIIGRLVPVKNHALFLQAWKKVADQNSKCRAFIIGDGESRGEIEAMATSLGIDFTDYPNAPRKASLTMTSWIKDVDRALAGLDVVTLTSLNEGTPVSLIEAQASNTPIVSTKVGGVADIVKAGETAFLVDHDDAEGCANHLLQLANDAELRERMSKQGWEFVNERFHYRRLAGDVANLYHRLLS